MSPLQRLYRTKLALLAVVLTVLGVAFLAIGQQTEVIAALPWLAWLPFSELGSTLFGSGLIVVAFEYINERDADERANERLRRILREEAPAFRDAVIDGFAFAPEALTNVASPETLDRVVRNTLSIQLGDPALADDLYADLRHQVTASTERRHDMRVSVSLTPWTKGPSAGEGSMFVATIRREYRVAANETTRRFACVSDMDQYRELLLDPTSIEAYYFEPTADIDAASPDAFELLQFTVDGRPRPIRRSKRPGGQSFTVTTSVPAGDSATEVEIAYTYRVLVQQHGHLLYLDFGAPCKGVDVDFAYGDCGIRHVNVLDFIAGSQPTRVSRSPKDAPPTISVRYDGWVFPKSGVAFSWVLEREMAAPAPARRSR